VLEGVQAKANRSSLSANFLIDAESNLKAALGGMQKAETAKPASVGHQAVGKLNSIDAAAGTVSVSHEPVASLKWPAMKMDFVLANPALVNGVKPGSAIDFEFVERQPGEWVITSLKPR
jgi:Cu/Ag efflux protein CusF